MKECHSLYKRRYFKMTFDTVKKWEEWYKHYSLLMGFGVRREDVRMNKNGEVIHAKMGMFQRRV
jgi:hypothetical protein